MLICILYVLLLFLFFFFKQKTAYEMRISDWSSDVCSSDLDVGIGSLFEGERDRHGAGGFAGRRHVTQMIDPLHLLLDRSEEHTSELQSLMRISYAVFCLKKKIYQAQMP